MITLCYITRQKKKVKISQVTTSSKTCFYSLFNDVLSNSEYTASKIFCFSVCDSLQVQHLKASAGTCLPSCFEGNVGISLCCNIESTSSFLGFFLTFPFYCSHSFYIFFTLLFFPKHYRQLHFSPLRPHLPLHYLYLLLYSNLSLPVPSPPSNSLLLVPQGRQYRVHVVRVFSCGILPFKR